jgi:hypothetical protein
MRKLKGDDEWQISEPDEVRRRVILGNRPIGEKEHSWSRRFLITILMSIFTVAFLICLVYSLVTKDFQAVEWVWKVFGPIFGFILGYYFGPHR